MRRLPRRRRSSLHNLPKTHFDRLKSSLHNLPKTHFDRLKSSLWSSLLLSALSAKFSKRARPLLPSPWTYRHQIYLNFVPTKDLPQRPAYPYGTSHCEDGHLAPSGRPHIYQGHHLPLGVKAMHLRIPTHTMYPSIPSLLAGGGWHWWAASAVQRRLIQSAWGLDGSVRFQWRIQRRLGAQK